MSAQILPRELSKRLASIRDAVLSSDIENQSLEGMLKQNEGVSTEEIYINRHVLDLVTKYNTLWINSVVILFTLMVIICALEISLRHQLTKV